MSGMWHHSKRQKKGEERLLPEKSSQSTEAQEGGRVKYGIEKWAGPWVPSDSSKWAFTIPGAKKSRITRK